MSWELTGNLGIDPATNYLGTTDNQPLVIKTNASERMFITTGGKVGVGTTTPGSNLHVNIPASGNPISALTLDVESFGTINNAIASYFLQVRDIGAAPPNGKTHFCIRGDGSVGIGTATPSAQLSVTGGASIVGLALGTDVPGIGYTYPYETVGVNNPNFNLRLQSPNSVVLQTGIPPTPKMIVRADGNVGIGTTEPRVKLDIVASGTYSNIEFTGHPVEISTRTSNNDYTLFMGADKTNKLSYIQSANINIAKTTLSLNPQGGNVGIGTTTPGETLTVNGNVSVTGDVILTGADCAEEFDIAEAAEIEPGTVMVLDQEGGLQQSQRAYDKRVAGVISGAGDYQPGLILDRRQSQENRMPVALVGKVYCKVDAQYAPIEVGDLLTTSTTPGHAMKADDPLKAFGAVLGKALRGLQSGQGLVPILVALQ